jgi:septal ring factor EnvC (AmiA/AmiB activator)
MELDPMKRPKNETGRIKCYNNQRKIGLPKGGVLGGCPENENPPEVTLLLKTDFDRIMETIEKVESFESDKNQLVDGYESKIKSLENEVNANTQRTDELKTIHDDKIKMLNQTIKNLEGDKATLQSEKDDYKTKYENTNEDLTKAMQWIGLSWGVLQNIRKKNRLQILFGGLDKTVHELPKPAPALLPADTKTIIDADETIKE